ncbi:GNAT family N-acetyltransferase [Anaerocolumna chitinilytica]|uniref:GNAT family acetyltransferase n=1 Tax=Anaerocolumna chitinilytica TaxID=1727145 RepID=A0A7I8DTL5_9FIRM|nr:GNAT family N-acetyltransferase [Anaerocolumna chitinilytica]BCJ99636.1 GNAT family acetyltransferase [Anaerocolumna chitinilytica]
MNHKGTVRLETERLILRRFIIEDLEQIFYNCWSDFEVWKWTSYQPMQNVKDVIDTAEMFTDKWLGAYERPNRYSWAIELKATGQVIGRFFGMHPDDYTNQIELAYELGRSWWNQGLMTEAVKAVIDFFFNEIGFNRIYANHAGPNMASGKVMQKAGLTYEGTMRQACKCNNGLFDKVNYAIIADDYIKSEKIVFAGNYE